MKKIYMLILTFLSGTAALEAQQVFTDDYAEGVSFAAFGGSANDLSIDMSEHHSGTASIKALVPAAGYTGGAFTSSAPLSLTSYNALTFWVKASKAVTLNVSGIGNNATSTTLAAEYNAVPVSTEWTKVIIPIPDASKLTASDGLFHFAEGSDEGAYTLWFDDIMYETLSGVIGTPTAAIATETIIRSIGTTFTVNGTTSVFPVNSVNQTIITAPAYFSYTSSNPDVASVNASGQGTAASVGTANITAMLGSVAASGTLTVNVVAASEPSTAAPTPPAREAANVISLFSNAYNNVPVNTWSASWDQADVADVLIGGNETKKYTNLNYAGIEFTSPVIDASTMTYFHIDIWTPNSTQFRIKLVDFGANGTYAGGDDTEHELTFTPELGQWVSYDIPLTDFTNMTAKAHLAQLIISGSSSTVFADNIYFYAGTVAPVQLSTFDVVAKENKAVLHWSTLSETNNKGFFVQHSIDGREWKELSFISGNGTTAREHQYKLTHTNPVKGINYYRLKQIDFDGKQKYSPVKTITFSGKTAGKITLFPNPAVNKVTISITHTELKAARFEIIDANGKVVKSGLFTNTVDNTSQQTVDVNTLAKGIYALKVYDGKTIKSVKFVRN